MIKSNPFQRKLSNNPFAFQKHFVYRYRIDVKSERNIDIVILNCHESKVSRKGLDEKSHFDNIISFLKSF